MLCIHLGHSVPDTLSNDEVLSNYKWLRDNGFIYSPQGKTHYILTDKGVKVLNKCINPMPSQLVHIVKSRDMGVINAYYDSADAIKAMDKQSIEEESAGGRPNVCIIVKQIL